MRIGHYQCICHAGDFDANMNTVLEGLEMAAERGLDIVSFPESFLAGYWIDEAKCRRHAWPLDGPEITRVLEETAEYPSMFMVGFNELRGGDLYNTVILVERGELVGTYSKAFPVMSYFTPGRELPVFEKEGVKFGIIICADGGYIEPTRILALKGARIIFAPHYNYIGAAKLIDHYVHVRSDHVARAVENGVFFVRGNNVERGVQESLEREGVGYGDSYILDPNGQIVAAANLHAETMIWADLDLDREYYGGWNKSLRSAQAFMDQFVEQVQIAGEE
ncbi:MAG: carbon-nitrogen hydrolase family protein [Armatimonadetes bacterium]|nr:carbon-nitrogen hydrolase family protein [Armatimonadota bacterium]